MSVLERHSLTIAWWALVVVLTLIVALNGGLRT